MTPLIRAIAIVSLFFLGIVGGCLGPIQGCRQQTSLQDCDVAAHGDDSPLGQANCSIRHAQFLFQQDCSDDTRGCAAGNADVERAYRTAAIKFARYVQARNDQDQGTPPSVDVQATDALWTGFLDERSRNFAGALSGYLRCRDLATASSTELAFCSNGIARMICLAQPGSDPCSNFNGDRALAISTGSESANRQALESPNGQGAGATPTTVTTTTTTIRGGGQVKSGFMRINLPSGMSLGGGPDSSSVRVKLPTPDEISATRASINPNQRAGLTNLISNHNLNVNVNRQHSSTGAVSYAPPASTSSKPEGSPAKQPLPNPHPKNPISRLLPFRHH
jgi:hypothetical protein